MAEHHDLSGQYATLLTNQRRLLEEAKAYKGQKPKASMKRSRQQLEQEFALIVRCPAKLSSYDKTINLKKETTKNMRQLGQNSQISSCFVGEAYPPCTLPLSCLVPIRLGDLTLETYHRGRVLIVKTFCKPLCMNAIQNAIEDEFGDVERLSVYNLLPTVAPSDILPLGAIIAVKEPYYKLTADRGLMVRVDHPSDLVSLKSDNKIVPLRLAPQIIKVTPSALSLKEAGNEAFKRGDWKLAVDFYSDALEVDSLECNDNDLWLTLHRNRAAAHLRLGHYELTITDALAALIPPDKTSKATKDANVKALYRAGKASYEIGDFAQAKQHFAQALEVDKNHKEAQAELKRTEKRLAEHNNGLYNFSAMAKSATKHHSRLDHASFLGNTEIAPAGRRGRGLFTTKPLNPGDVIFIEKAFHVAHTEGSRDMSVVLNLNTNRISFGSQAMVLYGIVDKMLWNPMLATKYLDLFDGKKLGDDKEANVIDGKVVVDTFRVQSIVEFNSFSIPRVEPSHEEERKNETDKEDSSGIWLRASYANHSCIPNAAHAFVGDMIVVRAVRHLRAGDEIFITYNSPTRPLAERKNRLLDGFGFECDCILCQAEAKVPKTIIAKRARLHNEVDTFLSENFVTYWNFLTFSPAKKAKAKKLLEEIRGTYPQALFEHLPRLSCVGIGLWVAQATAENGRDGLDKFLAVLRDTGYFINIKGKKVTIKRGNAVAMNTAAQAAMLAAQALAVIGPEAASSALEALAKEVYTAQMGVDEGFDAEFGGSQ